MPMNDSVDEWGWHLGPGEQAAEGRLGDLFRIIPPRSVPAGWIGNLKPLSQSLGRYSKHALQPSKGFSPTRRIDLLG